MTTIKLKGINKVGKRLANGEVKTYYYHRSTGTLLPGTPGSADFLEAYKQANRVAPRTEGTIADLIRTYENGPQFVAGRASARSRSRARGLRLLNETTKREYKRMLTALDKKFGAMPIAALAAPRVRAKFTDYQEEIGMDHPREADNRLMVLSAVFTHARNKGLIALNPLSGYARIYNGDRSDIIWLEADVLLFMENAPIELQRALILALHTGQRYGDLVRLRWADYDGEYIRLKQRRTGARVTVKVTDALKRMLDSTPKTCPYILARPDGRPWFTGKNDKEMGKAFREHREAAGLYRDDYLAETRNDPDLNGERLHFHDIRGTAVTLLAESSCSTAEIVAITGHTLENANKILEKYLARTRTLSDAAILKFENSRAAAFANRLQTSEGAKS